MVSNVRYNDMDVPMFNGRTAGNYRSLSKCCLMNVGKKKPATQLLTSVVVLYLLSITPVIWVLLFQVTCLLLYMLPTLYLIYLIKAHIRAGPTLPAFM